MNDKLKLLLTISGELSSKESLEVILEKLSTTTRALLNADICSIFLHDPKTHELWSIVKQKADETIRVPEGAGIVGHAFLRREMVVIDDAYEDPRFNRAVDDATQYRTRTILALPLTGRDGEPLGVVQVINKLGEEKFSRDDCDLLNHIAMFISSTVQNALLFHRIKRAQEAIINKLSCATRFKDVDTQSHTIRVGLYCEHMAKQLGWNPEERETVRLASMMHDVGKVGIPDGVLLKPGKYTDDEYALMKNHTKFGYEILSGEESQLSEMAALIALEHHERWDGKGYPGGKTGDDIGLASRMTKLGDEFDALTSVRPYKRAWSFDETMAHIKENRGGNFDPTLTELFLDNAQAMIKIRSNYKD